MNNRGSCLCGKIRYEVNITSDKISNCHCSYCRKHHGAAFGTYLEAVAPENFTWLEGEELLSSYQSSPRIARLFCSVCGSPLVADINDGETMVPIAGTLDGEFEVGKGRHIFWKSKASWFKFNDGFPIYDAYPPGLSESTPE